MNKKLKLCCPVCGDEITADPHEIKKHMTTNKEHIERLEILILTQKVIKGKLEETFYPDRRLPN